MLPRPVETATQSGRSRLVAKSHRLAQDCGQYYLASWEGSLPKPVIYIAAVLLFIGANIGALVSQGRPVLKEVMRL